MSDSVRPHGWPPTTLTLRWDSPGKSTRVGCHFLLQCMKVKSEREVALSHLTLATPWTTAYQAPPSMGFSRQKYWSGVPLPSPSTNQNPNILCILKIHTFYFFVYFSENFLIAIISSCCRHTHKNLLSSN